MATVTNKRKVLSVEEKIKIITEIENRGVVKEGGEPEVCWEFGLVNSANQRPEKPEPKLLVRLKGMDQEYSSFKSQNKVTSMRCCLK